ncbi:hypothetical protein DEA98_16615 [Brucella pseudogrignonensis]|nr:hypothetical protein [Brucella pseudogrignonensis]
MKRYNILSANGGLSGTTFGEEVTTDLPENFASLLRYDANNVYLDLEMSIGGLNVNQQNVSTALVNYFDENGQIPVAFGALDADGLSAVSGELATAAQQTTVDAMSQFMNTLADPLVTGRAGRITTSQTTDASAFENRWSVWGAGYGSARSTDGNATIGSHDTRGRVYGVAVGADYLVSPDTIIGFAVAGEAPNSASQMAWVVVTPICSRQVSTADIILAMPISLVRLLMVGRALIPNVQFHSTKRISSMAAIVPIHGLGDLRLAIALKRHGSA